MTTTDESTVRWWRAERCEDDEEDHHHHSCSSLTHFLAEVDSISDSLGCLHIAGAKSLTELPDAICQSLPRLTSLTIGSCERLRALPASLGHMPHLATVSVVACPALEALPESLAHSTSLARLHLGALGKLVGPLPAWLGRLPSLTDLDLSHSAAELPQPLGRLGQQLTSLRAQFVSYAVTQSLGQLSGLVALDFSTPDDRELPDGMGELRDLRRLRVCFHESERATLPARVAAQLPMLEHLEFNHSGCLLCPQQKACNLCRLP